MSNEEEKIANWSPSLFKGRKPYEYGKKIETMDMETGFIEEEFQEGEEEFQDDEPLTLINAQRKGHFS